jgi:hypothetical protein
VSRLLILTAVVFFIIGWGFGEINEAYWWLKFWTRDKR